jgi:hypothetical protein
VAKLDKSRIVLRRSTEYRGLRRIGAVVFLVLSLFFIWAGIQAWRHGTWIEWLIYLAPVLFFLFPSFLVAIRDIFQRVVLLENYVSIVSWHGQPRVYSYDQITNVETFVINANKWWKWEPETFVKVTFKDGKSVKIDKSLMSVRESRKFLRENTGRIFRRKPKRK